jgi:glycosyltransferase involved in cell wall biosynthesis
MAAMPDARPLLTVVTICRNAAHSIAPTLRSVTEQDYPSLEYVIIDGGSTDGTQSVIERHGGRVGRFTSEPDRGIAHAFNKGIAASTGRWILMLNAGDAFAHRGALSELAARAEKGARIVSARARCGRKTIPRYRIRPGLGLLLRAHISHQATLVHREVYARYGAYDESFRIRMDFDFFLRVLRSEAVDFVDRELVQFEPGGISARQFMLHWSEGRRALRKNRCGVLLRMEYEALFAALSCERLLTSVAGPERPERG